MIYSDHLFSLHVYKRLHVLNIIHKECADIRLKNHWMLMPHTGTFWYKQVIAPYLHQQKVEGLFQNGPNLIQGSEEILQWSLQSRKPVLCRLASHTFPTINGRVSVNYTSSGTSNTPSLWPVCTKLLVTASTWASTHNTCSSTLWQSAP